MTPSLIALALAAAVSAPAADRKDDWPEFRGPTGQGLVATGRLPVEWGADKNVAWKQDVPGKGWSSPVVADGKVFLTTAVPAKDSPTNDLLLETLCFDAKSGKPLWETEVFREDGKKAPKPHGKNSHASPTPLVSGDRVYVHFGHQGTACLDLDGKVQWRNNSVTYQPVHGNGGTPVLVDDALIFSCDGAEDPFVVALNKDSGKELWRTPRKVEVVKHFSFSTPLVITVNGKKQVVSPGSNAVIAYDPVKGDEIWRVRYEGYSVIPRPVYGHGLVFVSTSFDSPQFLAIHPDGKGDVTDTKVEWTTKKGAPHTPSPLLVGDELYLVSDGGLASCLDAKSGKEHWSKKLGGAYSASPLSADGKVYFQAEDGSGVVVKAATKYEEVARNDLGEKTYASYAAADGALFIRTEKHLYRFQEK
jgi:outer membrane protein assembly factor BamB